MHIADCIELHLAGLHAAGTSEGAEKGWEARGRGRTEKGETYLHKGFHGTLSKLGYNFTGTWGEKKAGTNASHYNHPVSNRDVSVAEDGHWGSKKGTWGTKESGENPSQFFEKYHGAKK